MLPLLTSSDGVGVRSRYYVRGGMHAVLIRVVFNTFHTYRVKRCSPRKLACIPNFGLHKLSWLLFEATATT